jgi:large subunit ribosomal protein L9
MRTLEVLLRDHVENLGRCGDVVRVKAGYARNYLLPRRIAIAATVDNKRAMERRRERLDIEDAARSAEIAARVAVFEGLKVATTVKADDNGRLYGSVNAAGVAALVRETGRELEDKAVRMDAPLRSVGEHAVRLHIHGEHYAAITVTVASETPAPPAASDEAPAADATPAADEPAS